MLATLAIGNGAGYYLVLGGWFVVAAFCVGALLVRLVRLAFRRGDPARLLRPVLVLAVLFALVSYMQFSLREAREIAGIEAVRVQAECVRAGCPAAPAIGAGDNPQMRDLSTPPTRLHWPIRYHGNGDGFELLLLEGWDMSRRWHGGAGVELAYERIDDGHATPLPLGGDGPPLFRAD